MYWGQSKESGSGVSPLKEQSRDGSATMNTQSRDGSATLSYEATLRQSGSGVSPLDEQSRDGSATMVKQSRDGSVTLSRHNRKESERFKSFTYDELTKRDKINLDIFWLKDEALEDSANLSAPEIIAQDITADLAVALEQFATIADDLKS